MKKIFSFALTTLIMLVFAGCSDFSMDQVFGNGDETLVTYKIQAAPNVGTRAVHDDDGKAANVTRYICEVYLVEGQTESLYTRKVNVVSKGTPQTEFQFRMVSSQDYRVLFWADCGEGENDKYYQTTAGLKQITFKKDANDQFIGNNDEMDAFFANDEITKLQGSYEKNIQLTRPFAQLNVITTDIDDIKTSDLVTTMEPQRVTMKVKAPTIFNAATSEVSGTEDIQYTANVYYGISGKNKKEEADAAYTYCTLAMNYFFAPATDKLVETVSLVAINGTNELTNPEFANIPLQRNYRTNIIGDLLTNSVKYYIEVKPGFLGDYDVMVQEVTTVAAANEALVSGIKSVALNNPSDAATAVVMPKATENQTIELAIKGVVKGGTVTIQNADGSNGPAVLAITTDATTELSNLVINLPNTHVTLNGQDYENVTATTGDNTLVVAEGVTVSKLIVNKGGLSILGTVEDLTIAADVKVKECKNLTAALKAIVDGHLADGYDFKQNGELWDVVEAPVAQVNGVKYFTIAEAVSHVDKDHALELLDQTAWDAATPVYYAGDFYATLAAAIESANALNEATIYCRPAANLSEAAAVIKTNVVVYGNGATLSAAPVVENASNHLTKDVTIALYNLKGAGCTATRCTNYTVDFTMENCDNANAVALGYSAGSGTNNVTVKGCTFSGKGIASANRGTVTVNNSTFAGGAPVSCVNKDVAKLTVAISNSTFTGCEPIVVKGVKEAGTCTLNVERCTFSGTTPADGNIIVGEPTKAAQGEGLVSWNVSYTEAALKKCVVHAAGVEPTTHIYNYLSTSTYVGANRSEFYKDNKGVYHIGGADGLEMFRVNKEGTNYNNCTFVLDADIDLEGAVFTPILCGSSDDWYITFDGKGHTISNFNLNSNSGKTGAAGIGFFDRFTGIIKNLTLEGVTATNPSASSARTAILIGQGGGTVIIDNCHIKNSTINGARKCGAFVGHAYYAAEITNSTINNVTINGNQLLGGFIGSVGSGEGGNVTLKNNKVNGLTINAATNMQAGGKTYTYSVENNSYGAFIGNRFNNGTVSIPLTQEGNTSTAVTFNLPSGTTANDGYGAELAL